MRLLQEIRSWKKKKKDLVSFLAGKVKEDKKLFAELVDILEEGSDVEKGTGADVMKQVTKDCPEIAEPYIEAIISHIDYEAPRVKWGIFESIGNISQKFPDKVGVAVPKIEKYVEDKSTVIRWCAAYALSEISKYNKKMQKALAKKFDKLIKKEKNRGVRNVYINALKFIGKIESMTNR